MQLDKAESYREPLGSFFCVVGEEWAFVAWFVGRCGAETSLIQHVLNESLKALKSKSERARYPFLKSQKAQE